MNSLAEIINSKPILHMHPDIMMVSFNILTISFVGTIFLIGRIKKVGIFIN